jgi:hypothetical protein
MIDIIERLNEWGTKDTERGKSLYKDIQDAIQELIKTTKQRDTLLAALKSLIKSLSDNDEEGLIEHTQPMMDARAAVEAVEGKPLLDEA